MRVTEEQLKSMADVSNTEDSTLVSMVPSVELSALIKEVRLQRQLEEAASELMEEWDAHEPDDPMCNLYRNIASVRAALSSLGEVLP
jgi:hypothetical protein